MSFLLKPTWTEGMKVLPEHFQQSDSYIQTFITQRSQYLSPNNWGIKSLKINEDLLSLGDIDITKVSGIFADGLIFNFDKADGKRLFISHECLDSANYLYLGIPHNEPYILSKKRVQDIYDLHKQPVEIIYQEPNLVLLTEKDDLNAYSVLLLFELLDPTVNQKVTINEDFIPAIIDGSVSRWLQEKLDYMVEMFYKRHKMIQYSITQPMQSRSVANQYDIWILSIISRSLCRLELLRSTDGLHPEILYNSLCEIQAELMPIYEKEKSYTAPIPYNHKSCYQGFYRVINKLVSYLQTKEHHQAIEIRMNKNQQNIWEGSVDRTALSTHALVILAVYHEDPTVLEHIRQDSDIKIVANSMIKQYLSLQLPGLPMALQTTFPPQIPYQTNTNYYLLETSDPLWQDILLEGEFAVFLNHKINKCSVRVWLIPNK